MFKFLSFLQQCTRWKKVFLPRTSLWNAHSIAVPPVHLPHWWLFKRTPPWSYSRSELRQRAGRAPRHGGVCVCVCGSRQLPGERAAPGPARGGQRDQNRSRTGPGGVPDTRVGSPRVPGAGHSRSLERLLGEGSGALLLLEGAQRLEGLRQLLHGGHVRSARAGGTGPRSDPPCHGRLEGPSAVPLLLALPRSRSRRSAGALRAPARHSRDEWGGRRSGPWAPPVRPAAILIRPVGPRAQAPPPGLPRLSWSRAAARSKTAHAHRAPPAWRHARLYVGTHRGARAAKGAGQLRELQALWPIRSRLRPSPRAGAAVRCCAGPPVGSDPGAGAAVLGSGQDRAGQGRAGGAGGGEPALGAHGSPWHCPAGSRVLSGAARTPPARQEQPLWGRTSRGTAGNAPAPAAQAAAKAHAGRSGFILGCGDSYRNRTLKTWQRTCCPFSRPLLSGDLLYERILLAHTY